MRQELQFCYLGKWLLNRRPKLLSTFQVRTQDSYKGRFHARDRIRQSAAIDVMFLEKQIVELGAVMNDDLNTKLLRRRRICTSGCHSSSQSFLQNVAQQKTYSTSTLPCSFLQGLAKGLSMSEHGHLTEFDDPRRW